jgi:hypothetical protein
VFKLINFNRNLSSFRSWLSELIIVTKEKRKITVRVILSDFQIYLYVSFHVSVFLIMPSIIF